MSGRCSNLALLTAFLLTSALPVQASGSGGRIPEEVFSEGAGPSNAQPSTPSAAAAENSNESAAGPAQDSSAPTHDEAMRCFDVWSWSRYSQENAEPLSQMLRIARFGDPDDRLGAITRLWDFENAQQQYPYREEFAPLLLDITRNSVDQHKLSAIYCLWYALDDQQQYPYRAEVAPMLFEIARNPESEERHLAINLLWYSKDNQQKDYRRQLCPVVLALSREISSMEKCAYDFLTMQPQYPATHILRKKLKDQRRGGLRRLDFSDVTKNTLYDILSFYLCPAFVANNGVISYLSPEMLHVTASRREEQQLQETAVKLIQEQQRLKECLDALIEAYNQTETATAPAAAATTTVEANTALPLALVMLSGVVLEETMLQRRIAITKLRNAHDSLMGRLAPLGAPQ